MVTSFECLFLNVAVSVSLNCIVVGCMLGGQILGNDLIQLVWSCTVIFYALAISFNQGLSVFDCIEAMQNKDVPSFNRNATAKIRWVTREKHVF